MDLAAELGRRQSLIIRKRIVNYVGNNKIRFGELVKIFFNGEYRLTQHAAWPISYCIQNHPTLLNPFIKKFIEKLSDGQSHPAVKRNIVRLLQFVEIPKRHHGEIMDLCFRFINSPGEAIAVKAFSLHILQKFCILYPEILPELKAIVEVRWANETAAFRSRGRKILHIAR